MIKVEDSPKKSKRSHGNPEARIQADCVLWLWNNLPQTRHLYFCVNNENARSGFETKRQQLVSGSYRKSIGIVAGVSDTILMIPNDRYHALCIEFKTEIGRQSDVQKSWQRIVESKGYRYVIIRSLEEFKEEVISYLKTSKYGEITTEAKEPQEIQPVRQ